MEGRFSMKSAQKNHRASRGPWKGAQLEALESRTLMSASFTPKIPQRRHRLPVEQPLLSSIPLNAATALENPVGAAASVVGRYIYYAETPRFGDVLAADKTALLPGQTAGFSNITSYAGGIDEIAIDIANAASSYAASDFIFRAGVTSDPATWSAAPAPLSVTVVPGAGVSGSTRVYVKWADGTIVNQWLQVKFSPANDVFYFGNLVGAVNGLQVSAADEAAVRANPKTLLHPAAATEACDFNHDGKVDAVDQLTARGRVGEWLCVLAPPLPPVAYDWHQQTINGVLNIWAPNPSDFGTTWTVTDPNALFGSDSVPQLEGVYQGSISDCYFIAAGGSLALNNPSRIQAIVSEDSYGGWAVTFKWWNTQLFTYVPVVVHTSKQLSSSLQHVANGEVWSLVLEKAYACLRSWNGTTSVNTMASLNFGYPSASLTALGDTNTTISYSTMSQATLYSTIDAAIAARKPVLFTTSGTAPTMVKSHVYVITGVFTDTSGVRWIKTYNPWGFYDTRTQTDLLSNGVGSIVIGTY